MYDEFLYLRVETFCTLPSSWFKTLCTRERICLGPFPNWIRSKILLAYTRERAQNVLRAHGIGSKRIHGQGHAHKTACKHIFGAIGLLWFIVATRLTQFTARKSSHKRMALQQTETQAVKREILSGQKKKQRCCWTVATMLNADDKNDERAFIKPKINDLLCGSIIVLWFCNMAHKLRKQKVHNEIEPRVYWKIASFSIRTCLGPIQVCTREPSGSDPNKHAFFIRTSLVRIADPNWIG